MRQQAIPIYCCGLRVGEVLGGIFIKRVRYSVHRLKTRDAWATDVEALDEAERRGARLVRVEDQETGIVYEIELSTLRQRGERGNFGTGKQQIALPLKKWRQSGNGKEQRYEQLSLLP